MGLETWLSDWQPEACSHLKVGWYLAFSSCTGSQAPRVQAGANIPLSPQTASSLGSVSSLSSGSRPFPRSSFSIPPSPSTRVLEMNEAHPLLCFPVTPMLCNPTPHPPHLWLIQFWEEQWLCFCLSWSAVGPGSWPHLCHRPGQGGWVRKGQSPGRWDTF